MRYRYLLLTGVVLAVLPMLYFLFPDRSVTDGIGPFTEWRPTPGELLRAVGKGDTGHFNDRRHQAFVNLFKKRFRDHTAGVSLKFLDDSRIKVMCIACIPRWDMARAGVAAWREAREAFNRDYETDIFATTALNQIKVAEVRRIAGSDRATVLFLPSVSAIVP
jgi:hypothetical protein